MTSIEAHSIIHDMPPTALEVVAQDRLYGGGFEYKHVIAATVGERPVSLIQRHYEERYVDTWEEFRAAGLPVVPTLRVAETEGHKSLLVTDLKADGSELYGKGLLVTLSQGDVRERPPIEMVDRRFLELTSPANIEQIQAQANEYAAVADKNEMILPIDDPFELLIKPDGAWGLIIVDLYWGGKISKDYIAATLGMGGVDLNTQRLVEQFINNLHAIRKQLQQEAGTAIWPRLPSKT